MGAQYHIWLSNNAAAILVILPGAPVLNAVIAFAGFLAAADVAYRCTGGIAGSWFADGRPTRVGQGWRLG